MPDKYLQMKFKDLASALTSGGLEKRLVEVDGLPKSVVPHGNHRTYNNTEYFGMLGSPDSDLLIPFVIKTDISGGFQAAFLAAVLPDHTIVTLGGQINKGGKGKHTYYLKVHHAGDGKQEF